MTEPGSLGGSDHTSASAPSDGEDLLRRALERARALGYFGPGPIEGHLDHARAFARTVISARPDVDRLRIADLGSGGGLPGLALATWWPGSRWVYLDAHQRRMSTLADALRELDVSDRASIACGRAEELARRADLRGSFDVVVARGFAGAAVTAECAAPLLRQGGLFVVSDPPTDQHRWPADGLAQLGLVGERVVTDGFAFFVATAVTVCPDRYPRRVGIPEKRPLF